MTSVRAKAEKAASTFRGECSIRATIAASPERIWALLTDTAGYARWNSTVSSIEGQIAEGQTLRLEVPSAPKRVFKPKVSQVQPGRCMTWSDGMAPMFRGVRVFTLAPNADGTTDFQMKETFSGLMFPLIKGALPDFAPIFEAYADDLKRAAERRAG